MLCKQSSQIQTKKSVGKSHSDWFIPLQSKLEFSGNIIIGKEASATDVLSTLMSSVKGGTSLEEQTCCRISPLFSYVHWTLTVYLVRFTSTGMRSESGQSYQNI